MARAVFEVIADTTSVTASLSGIPAHARRSATAMRREFRSAFTGMAADAQRSVANVKRAMLSVALEERKLTDATKQGAKARAGIRSEEASKTKSIARRATDDAIREEQRLTTAAERGAQRRVAAAKRAAREVVQAEQRATGYGSGGSTPPSRGRSRGRAAGVVSGAAGAAGAAAQFGSAVMSETRSELERTADFEQSTNQAFQNARYGSANEVQRGRARVAEEARRLSMDPEVIARALATGQQFGDVLAGASEADRARNLETALSTVKFARDVGEDPTQLMRLQGVANMNGIRDPRMVRAIMRNFAGMARRGSVDISSVTDEALGGMMANMSGELGRLGPGASEAAQQSTIQNSLGRSMAFAQLGAASGLSPRDTLNAVTKMDRSLMNDRTTGANA